MVDRRLKNVVALVLALVFTVAASGCVGGEPDGDVPTKSDGSFDLEVVDNEACEAAGYQELIGFLLDNDIEVRNEEVDDEYPYCKIEMIWAVASDGGNRSEATLYFDLRVFDSIAEAQQVVEEPEKLFLNSVEFRQRFDSQVENLSGPWDDGFVWSTPDANPGGMTEVVARMENIVVYADFDYATLDASQCEGEGCVVFPSTLVAWIHDIYLPAVEQNVNDLVGR